jgi:hypothetical protein
MNIFSSHFTSFFHYSQEVASITKLPNQQKPKPKITQEVIIQQGENL